MTTPDEIPYEPWPKIRGNPKSTILSCLESGFYAFHNHCKDEQRNHNLVARELIQAVTDGNLDQDAHVNPRYHKDSKPKEWSWQYCYRAEERTISTVVRFRNKNEQPFLVFYTCWDKPHEIK